MKSIINNNKKEYIINKSRFICNMIYINDIEDVNKYLLDSVFFHLEMLQFQK